MAFPECTTVLTASPSVIMVVPASAARMYVRHQRIEQQTAECFHIGIACKPRNQRFPWTEGHEYEAISSTDWRGKLASKFYQSRYASNTATFIQFSNVPRVSVQAST